MVYAIAVLGAHFLRISSSGRVSKMGFPACPGSQLYSVSSAGSYFLSMLSGFLSVATILRSHFCGTFCSCCADRMKYARLNAECIASADFRFSESSLVCGNLFVLLCLAVCGFALESC